MVKNKEMLEKDFLEQVAKQGDLFSGQYLVSEKKLESLVKKLSSSVPTKLTRTALFTTKSKDFITDSNYKRWFINNYSTIRVSGRELGVPHRKLIYSLFKLNPTKYETPNPLYDRKNPKNTEPEFETKYTLVTSFREVLTAMDLTVHRHNVEKIMETISDMQKVVITIFEDSREAIEEKLDRGLIPKGSMSNVIQGIRWNEMSDPKFDDKIIIEFGHYITKAIELKQLASINMKVFNNLKKDYSVSIWPYINSHTNKRSFITEEDIAQLVNVEFEELDKAERKEFRRRCRDSFGEMKKLGGLEKWGKKEKLSGSIKSIQYWYTLGEKKENDRKEN